MARRAGHGSPPRVLRASSRTWTALSPARRAVLDEPAASDGQMLLEVGGRPTTTHGLTSTRQAMSRHLAVLEQAGPVRTRRRGRCRLHHIDPGLLRSVAQRWPTDREGPTP